MPKSFEDWYEQLPPDQQETVRVNLMKAEAPVDEGPPPVGTARIAAGYAAADDPSEVRAKRREARS